MRVGATSVACRIRKFQERQNARPHSTVKSIEDIIIKNIIYFTLILLCLINISCKSAYAEDDWALTLYGSRLTAGDLSETLNFKAKYEDSYLVALSVSKRVLSFRELIDIEIEGQAVKHFGDQNHWEFNGVPVIRWLPFPWDAFIDTSFAAGAGLSYATETPPIEAIGVDHTPKLLGYLMFEFAFSLPNSPKYLFVARVHHRSGANGLFDGRLDASNAIGFGIKYIF